MPMEKIGNVSELIQQEWIDYVYENKGLLIPKERKKFKPDSKSQQSKFIDYKSDIHYEFFDKDNTPFNIPRLLVEADEPYKWWITKMNPKNFFMMHNDGFPGISFNRRYWIPLQDYVSGHVFIYEDELVKDYKRGDVFKYDNLMAQHGAVNIGYTPRATLQIAVFEKETRNKDDDLFYHNK